jgi:hypothetical protein
VTSDSAATLPCCQKCRSSYSFRAVTASSASLFVSSSPPLLARHCQPPPHPFCIQEGKPQAGARDSAALHSWVQHRVAAYLAALRAHLPNVTEGGGLASVLEHCNYCGASLSRVGLDFRVRGCAGWLAGPPQQRGQTRVAEGQRSETAVGRRSVCG